MLEFLLILPLLILFALFSIDLGVSISDKAMMVDQARMISREMMRHRQTTPTPEEMCTFAKDTITSSLADQGIVVDVTVEPLSYNLDYFGWLFGGSPMNPAMSSGAAITITRNQESRPTFFGDTGMFNSVTVVVPLVNLIQNVSSTVASC